MVSAPPLCSTNCTTQSNDAVVSGEESEETNALLQEAALKLKESGNDRDAESLEREARGIHERLDALREMARERVVAGNTNEEARATS